MQYECIKAKSLLSKPIVADSWFHVNRFLNAYRGCEHGCVYCDGMSEGYHVDDFFTCVRIKENAPEILRRELMKDGFVSQSEMGVESLLSFLDKEDAARIGKQGPRKQVIGVCGGVSDGYQPAERQYQVTRRNLEVLRDFGLPVFVLTKSDLVLRDLDILKEIHKQAFANVTFTITLYDEHAKQVFEPKSASTSERFDALKEVRKAGLFGGVMAVPLIPGIGDTYENITGLATEAKRAGAESIVFGGLTLKPGRQKEYFLNVLKKQFPEQHDLLARIYSNNDKYGRPDYAQKPVSVMIRGHQVCKEVGISDRSVRHKMPGEHDSNNEVLGVLLDMIFYQVYALGLPRYKSRRYEDLATTLEQGVEDLTVLRKEGKLQERLRINAETVSMIERILDSGTCSQLEEIERTLDSAESGRGQVFTAWEKVN
jgi:DNA repair photolyase